MLKKFKKFAVVAAMTVGVMGGAAAKANAGYVCEGTTLYESVGWWIFQFPIGEGMEDAEACQGY